MIKIEEKETMLIVTVSGCIGLEETIDLDKNLSKALTETDRKKIIIDCTSLSYLSSSGVGVFIETIKKATRLKKDIRFYNIQNKVFEVLQLLGFSEFFKIVNNLGD